MLNKNKIVLTVAVVVILGLSLYYWMSGSSVYSPSSGQNSQVQTDQQIVVSMASNAQFAKYLIGPSGMALYFKEGDLNTSSCYGQCAINWPPLLADGELIGANGVYGGALGTINRTDGTKQVTYNLKPLYYWISDKNIGDTTGNGVGNIWSIAIP